MQELKGCKVEQLGRIQEKVAFIELLGKHVRRESRVNLLKFIKDDKESEES